VKFIKEKNWCEDLDIKESYFTFVEWKSGDQAEAKKFETKLTTGSSFKDHREIEEDDIFIDNLDPEMRLYNDVIRITAPGRMMKI